jgi:hypothetical protein
MRAMLNTVALEEESVS